MCLTCQIAYRLSFFSNMLTNKIFYAILFKTTVLKIRTKGTTNKVMSIAFLLIIDATLEEESFSNKN
jgi:hypothetical protein